MTKPNIAIDRLHNLLRYEPQTGEFTWLIKMSPRAMPGAKAGSTYGTGYRVICIDGKDYLAHRLAWAMVHGMWPGADIDHINGNRADNRIENLRDVPRTVNSQNQRRAHVDKKTCGLIGATWDKRWGKWKAQITVNKKTINLGRFKTAEEAHQAYLEGKRKCHAGCAI